MNRADKRRQKKLSQKAFERTHENISNLFAEAVQYHKSAQLKKAEVLYKKIINIKSDIPELHSNLGSVQHTLGDYVAAEISLRKALALNSDNADAHGNLGNVLREFGRLNEAESSYREAIALKSDFAEAYSNLGVTLQELGRLDEAEASCGKAIALNPDDAKAYVNLGVTLQKLDRLAEAEASFRNAIALKSDYAEAHSNLGVTLQELGRAEDAIESYKQALKINPDNDLPYHNMGIALNGIRFTKPMPDTLEFICKLLEKENFVRPRDVSIAAISLLKFDPIIKEVVKIHSAGNLVQLLQKTIVNLSKIPLLIKLMEISLIADWEFEVVFKDIRAAILLNISNIKINSEILTFQSALAFQCFTNEYLYDQTSLEIEALIELENLVEKKLINGQQPNPIELACIASYKALNEYTWAHLLRMPIELEGLQRKQILEPEKEKQLRPKIPILQELTDIVSCKVREQYEQNPYPRWVNLGLPIAPKSISTYTKELKLKISNLRINEVSAPQILIAGCGTGNHSITTASMFKGCDVFAIDLSLSSLAYAKRKTEELGISNIEYMQADILDLEKQDRQFDIIESVGVLHHMDDPMAGWKVLTNCLKPGGIMRIGLYSSLARQHISQLREEIERSEIGSSEEAMKSFRHYIASLEEEMYESILQTVDFYSMSMLRDLLFHVQEHQFTIPQIKDCLAELGLVFCGFITEHKIQFFKSKGLATNAFYDLEKWDVFEKKNPSTFKSMYNFWCQKD